MFQNIKNKFQIVKIQIFNYLKRIPFFGFGIYNIGISKTYFLGIHFTSSAFKS